MTDHSFWTRRRFASVLLPLAITALLPATVLSQEQRKWGIVGQMAPKLNVEFWIDGRGQASSFNLAAQRGKWVYIKCWQAWCPACHSHGFPTLKKITDAFYDEPRVVTLGIQTTFEGHNFNTGDKLREIQLKYDLPVLMGHDPGQRTESGFPNTMLSYRTGGTPWHILIAPNGVVVSDGFRTNADHLIATVREYMDSFG